MNGRHLLWIALTFIILQPLSLAAQLASSLASRIPLHPKLQSTLYKGPPALPPMPVRPLPTARFQLLTSTMGWAATDHVLLKTTNGGTTWKNITPPNTHHIEFNPNHDALASVCFNDPSTGWVLFGYRRGLESDDWTFDLSLTTDGGATWFTTPLRLPGIDPHALQGGGHIAFSDALHGWINVDVKSSSAFQMGALFATVDGGRTWQPIKGDPDLAGPILPSSSSSGWLLAHDGSELYSIRNGEAIQMSLHEPDSTGSPAYTTYSLPAFHDRQHGYMVVTYSRIAPAETTAVLFQSNDGGLMWKADSSLAGLTERSTGGRELKTMVADSTWIIAFAPTGKQPRIMSVPQSSIMTAADDENNGSASASFISPTQGWVYCSQGLLSTSDGGTTWRNITPTSGIDNAPANQLVQSFSNASTTMALPAATVAYSSSPAPGISQRLGFDAYSVPSPSTMQTWWNASPYYDVAFYANGAESHANDPTVPEH